MEQYLATNWNELLHCVKDAKSRLKNPEQIWFRGQSNSAFALLPGLMRAKNGTDKESFIFQKFVRYSFKAFTSQKTDWEALFDMQHYGLPTRLLDWSETLGIATFFAVNYTDGKSDAAIYVLDPVALNEYSGVKEVPFIPENTDFDYKKIYWEKKPFAPVYPIAIQPIFQNDRILAQAGMFTVHGDDATPIEKLCQKAVKKVLLSQKAILEAQEFLEISNINARSVFPDMMGVAAHVKHIAGL
jgi:hypothetical protein